MKENPPPVVRVIETPWGRMSLAADERGLVGVTLPGIKILDHRLRTSSQGRSPSAAQPAIRNPESAMGLLDVAEREILEYLAGRRREFTVPVDLTSLPTFRQKVLRACAKIPYGATATYGELAARVGQPRAARAVGQAMAGNPVPLVIPCHRVVACDGSLGGFLGGTGAALALKRKLLELEAGL